MRIVAGRHRGTKLTAPEGSETRPTADRTRESLFNILGGGRFGDPVTDKIVLDGFAGSGALGLEALSRGAAMAVFLEQDQNALGTLRKNIDRLGRAKDTMIIAGDATRPPRSQRGAAGLVMLDPPYNTDLAENCLDALVSANWIDADTLCVVEIAKKQTLRSPKSFSVLDERKYGSAKLGFLKQDA